MRETSIANFVLRVLQIWKFSKWIEISIGLLGNPASNYYKIFAKMCTTKISLGKQCCQCYSANGEKISKINENINIWQRSKELLPDFRKWTRPTIFFCEKQCCHFSIQECRIPQNIVTCDVNFSRKPMPVQLCQFYTENRTKFLGTTGLRCTTMQFRVNELYPRMNFTYNFFGRKSNVPTTTENFSA